MVVPFGAEALFTHVNVLCKAVFSHAMTSMEKIRGWEDEEKLGGIQICHVHVDLHQKKHGQKNEYQNPAMEKYLKKRMMSIMLCTNWVCAGTFIDHEWVSESTISLHEEEILGMELDYGLDVPCVVQWSLLWFSAPARLNKTLEQDLKIKKHHEGCQHCYYGRYFATIWRLTHSEVVHVDISGKRPTQNTREVESEQGDGRVVERSLQPSFSDGDDEDDESGDE